MGRHALDEPTNHLDIEGITWLAAHLKEAAGRTQSGRTAAGDPRPLVPRRGRHDHVGSARRPTGRDYRTFDGGYAAYILQRVERDRIAAATEAKRQNLMRKELAWLRRSCACPDVETRSSSIDAPPTP